MIAVTPTPIISYTSTDTTRVTEEAADRLSADIKKHLFNGEDPRKVMDSLEYYTDISPTTIAELTDYICE